MVQTSTLLINPYVGPRTFTEQEGRFFFGREREARDLTARIVSERLLLFYAQSGAGKSSLINARVIPKLRDEEHFQVLPVGRVSGDLPAGVDQVGNIYTFNLMTSLDQSDERPERLADVTLSDFLSRLARETVTAPDGERTWRWVYKPEIAVERPAEPASPASAQAGPRFVLVIDQFEEIITGHPGRWQEREAFFGQLNRALLDDPNLWVVLTLREDYVAALDPYAELTFNRLRARFYMERMGVDAARDAVRQPAGLGGRPFAPGVAERLVDDLRQVRVTGRQGTIAGQYVEPVQLQVVCYQLWERLHPDSLPSFSIDPLPPLDPGLLPPSPIDPLPPLDPGLLPPPPIDPLPPLDPGLLPPPPRGRVGEGVAAARAEEGAPAFITEADLVAAGDVNEALAQFYEETLAAVLDGPEAAGVGERQLRVWFDQELVTGAGTRGLVHQSESETGGLPNAVVQALQRRFLVRAEARSGDTWIELVHDRFVEPIRAANRVWLAQNQNPLAQAATDWEQAGRATGKLLRGERLKEAQAQVKAHPDDFSELEQEFLAASAEAERQAATRRQRLIGTAAAALAVLFALLATAAFVNAVRANQQRQLAETAQQDTLAQSYLTNAQSAVASGTLPERSALLSVGSVQFAGERGILEPAVALDQLERTLAVLGGTPLRGHEGAVNTVAFSPKCDEPPSASAERCEPRLASGGADGTVRLWDVRNPFAGPVTLTGHSGAVDHVAFSSDKRWLASSSADHTVRLWDLRADPPAAQALSADGSFYRLSFSPSGRWLTAVTSDGKVRLWDMTTAPQVSAPHVLDHAYTGAISAVFSGDEQRLMTTAQDGNFAGEVRVWSASDQFSQPEATFPYEYIAGSAMSADGAWIAVSTPTYTELRRIGAATDEVSGVVQRFPGFGYIYAMAFSPDSRSFSSGSSLWRLNDQGRWDEPVRLVGQPQAGVYFPTFSRECGSPPAATPEGCGRWLAAVSADYTVYRWDLSDLTRLPYVYRGHEGNVNDLAFSPDASLLATAGGDGVVRLWNAHSPTAGPAILHPSGDQADVRLWDASAADPSQTPRRVGFRPDNYRMVAISPDGRWVALASEGGASDVFVWDSNSPLTKPRQLDHPGAVAVIKFSPACDSPAGQAAEPCHLWLAVGDWSGNVRLWDPSTPAGDGFAYLDLPHGASVRDLAFSDGNRLLITGDNQGLANLWRLDPVDPTQTPVVLSGHTSFVRAVAISSSGRWVLSGSWEPDLTARLWDLDKSTAEPVAVLPFNGRLFAAAFSPDERWAAVGSWDATAKLVRLDDPTAPPVTLDQHRGRILSMAVSPDSHWLATGGEDRRIILWDLTAPDPSVAYAVLRSPTGSGTGVQVAFSADGRWLSAFGSAAFSSEAPWLVTVDNDVHLFNLPVDEVMDRICLAVGRTSTEEGWQRYAPDLPYRPICAKSGQSHLATRLEAQSSLLDGDDRAAAGDVAAARALYLKASDLDPSLAAGGSDAAERRLVLASIEAGKEAAVSGQIERAAQLFAQAAALDPAIVVDPDAEAQRLATERQQQAAASAATVVFELSARGAYREAMQRLAEIDVASPGVAITSTLPADDWNRLCWDGALAGQVEAVMPACARAVSLAPEDGGIRDSRGLARALTGDPVGAIADFDAAVQWAQTTGYGQDFVDQRQAWIDALKAGTNPFDEPTLEGLRNN